jgi:hypothetical protein
MYSASMMTWIGTSQPEPLDIHTYKNNRQASKIWKLMFSK